MIIVRSMEQGDFDFLMDMHYESIHIQEGKPPKDELLNAPAIKKYSEGWGRSGDRALIAWNETQAVGAVWYRLFDESDKGYGFVDPDTPELGVAILPDARGQGVGLVLMNEIMQQARADGYKALSLSVDPDNQAAVRLYEKLGFEYCGMCGTSWTMKVAL
ncbi:GNAT family N-acetyltransferase [Paenibacillus sp. CF384]|uniref:GNAT family N-acetyltransferase n=1 Tax=Paenibacillus sp. CF384 TaxID=1884382 RepID=UPI0008954E79|nr:GNAT family N-acetyltransferase [Paenibacillus sp. CF384]SDW14695.1 Acetyltransferase (GNAT) family protein [Paenibacillus sp. CF384]